jgi:hypothetical protein
MCMDSPTRLHRTACVHSIVMVSLGAGHRSLSFWRRREVTLVLKLHACLAWFLSVAFPLPLTTWLASFPRAAAAGAEFFRIFSRGCHQA